MGNFSKFTDQGQVTDYEGNMVFLQNSRAHNDKGPAVITKTGWRLFYKEGIYQYCKRSVESGDETIYKLPCDICLVKTVCKEINHSFVHCDLIGFTIVINEWILTTDI